MSDLLLVLNPRRIPACLAATHELQIDKLWIRNLCEYDIAERWDEVLELSEGYENLVVFSDDAIVRQNALDSVLALLKEHPVATGWANLAGNDMRANLCKTPLGPEPAPGAYDLYTVTEAFGYPDPVIPTHLVGFALTAMSRELWTRFPFQVWKGADGNYDERPGNASDFCMSKRLDEAKVPMVAAREGFIWHVKDVWNVPDADPVKRLLIGHEPAEITLERRPA